jgi:hypothetical protein
VTRSRARSFCRIAAGSSTEGRQRLSELLRDRMMLLILDDVWRREDADAFNAVGPRCRMLASFRFQKSSLGNE